MPEILFAINMPPIAVAGIAIVLLLLMILRFKLNAFIALLVASMAVGLLSDMPITEINSSIQEGMAGALGFIATIVGLGAIFGKILEHSGGTEALARELLKRFGMERAPWAMVVTGFLVSIPVFLDAGLVILIPVIYALTRESGKPILYFGIPLVAGMSVTHSFVPPTPGPVAVADLLDADLGWVILLGVITGLPTAIIAGPVFGAWISKRMPSGVPEMMNEEGEALKEMDSQALPAFWLILGLIGLPILMILASSICDLMVDTGALAQSGFTDFMIFFGHPFAALILATLLAMYFLGFKRGSTKEEIMEISTRALAPAGIIILITGAGGVFKQILIDSNAAADLAEVMKDSQLPIIILCYLLSALVRVIQGSATVAMITAASLMAPIIDTMGVESGRMETALWALAIAAGSIICGHVNDSGFWLLNRYFGQTEKETLQSFTVMFTLVSVVGFGFVFLLSLLV